MRFVINGGKKLKGEIKLAGAKNAATKMMITSLLTPEPCILENFPQIGDTQITAELCQILGSQIKIKNNTLKIQTPKIKNSQISSLSRRNRIPILTLGPLLNRVGKAEVPIVGGDKIGPRPVDLHFNALRLMGAKIEILPDRYKASVKNGLVGAKIKMAFPSVGATENTLLAAVLARGQTIIQNAAVEPEIIDLIKMLQKMGAIIELGTDRLIKIEGVSKLKGVRHRILSDRNEAVSFACLAVATDSRILVRGACQENLITFLNALRKLGGEYEMINSSVGEGIIFYRARNLTALNITTDSHPGFMTDWQQPFGVLLTQARGQSIIHETIYEDRFGYAKDLNLIGADIKIIPQCPQDSSCRFRSTSYLHTAIIKGPTLLKGGNFQVRDLRSGIAHVIAALVAKGKSIIDGVEEIDRGYEKIDERLRSLGADIKRLD